MTAVHPLGGVIVALSPAAICATRRSLAAVPVGLEIDMVVAAVVRVLMPEPMVWIGSALVAPGRGTPNSSVPANQLGGLAVAELGISATTSPCRSDSSSVRPAPV